MTKYFKYEKYNDFLYYCLQELIKIVPDEIYLVGGLIREKLLGKESYDYDFVINNNAIDVAMDLAKRTKGAFVLLDEERNIARVVWNMDRNGHELNFDISTVVNGHIDNDLKLRDLTINSIATRIDLISSKKFADNNYQDLNDNLVDVTNGYQDLIDGKIRTYNKANLIDDPLRILRVFRFATKFNFEIESQTLDYVKELAQLIIKPAKERVLKELFEIFNSKNSAKYLEIMNQANLFKYLFINNANVDFSKAINKIKLYEESINKKQIIFKYNAEIDSYLKNNLIYNHNKEAVLKLVILFSEFKIEEADMPKFLKSIEKILKEYTFSSVELQFILKNISYYYESKQLFELELNRTNLYKLFKNRGNEVIGSLLLNYLDAESPMEKNKIVEIYNYFIEDKLLSVQPQLINGQDLMKELNLRPGKIIGEILNNIQQAQAEMIINNYDQALDYAKKYI